MKNIFPEVPQVGFRTKNFGIWKWHFPKSRIGETVQVNGQEVKKLLTLDINIPEATFAGIVNQSPVDVVKKVFGKNYPCPHACPGCFNNATVKNPIMTYDEVMRVIDQALELGLESVKFLGPGELLANPELFTILDGFRARGIVIGIFTKAAILGSDTLALKYQGMSAEELIHRMTNYWNTTFLVGGRSFDPTIENKYIPTRRPELRPLFDYHESRNRAIEMLCARGMNGDPDKQRISTQVNPVTPETISGAFEIFRWSIERNIPAYVTTTMISGKGHGLIKSQQELQFEEDYKNLAVTIYRYLLDKGIMTLEQLKEEKISSYLGVSPCNQLTHGMYIHYDGEVWRCPGNDTDDFVVHHNVREGSLVDIWTTSKNYPINKHNNFCVKDGVSIPKGFYRKVLRRIEKERALV